MGPPAAEIPVGVNLTESDQEGTSVWFRRFPPPDGVEPEVLELRPLPSFRGQSHSAPLTTRGETDFKSVPVERGEEGRGGQLRPQSAETEHTESRWDTSEIGSSSVRAIGENP